MEINIGGYSTWLILSGKMLLASPVPVCQLMRGYSYFCALIRQSGNQIKTTKITTIIMIRTFIQVTALLLITIALFWLHGHGEPKPFRMIS